MNHIIDGIYLGDLGDAMKARRANDGIGTLYVHEFEVQNYTPTYHVPIMVKVDTPPMPIGDDDFSHYTGEYSVASMDRILKCRDIIQEWSAKGDPLLVHCHGGIERSPLTLAFWLFLTGREHSLDNAYRFIRDRRPVVEDRRYWI